MVVSLCIVSLMVSHFAVAVVAHRLAQRRNAVKYEQRLQALLTSQRASLKRISEHTSSLPAYVKGPNDMRDRLVKFITAEEKKN